MNFAVSADLEPAPIEIDPRPCELCGLTIDRHQIVDDGEGPVFFCLSPDELTLPELELRAELIRQVEIAEILARMDAIPEFVPDMTPPREPEPYRPPAASTVDAFFYLVRLGDVDRLRGWIEQHPLDAPALYKLWEDKNARS